MGGGVTANLRLFSRGLISVAVVDGSCPSSDVQRWCPAGHSFHSTRTRVLRQSVWIVATAGSKPLGLAAYRRDPGAVRVVHEFLLDRTLTGADQGAVSQVLLAGVEWQALDDQVTCLMVQLDREVVVPDVFRNAGYAAVGTGPAGAWVRKRLDGGRWSSPSSARSH